MLHECYIFFGQETILTLGLPFRILNMMQVQARFSIVPGKNTMLAAGLGNKR
jgi:hypothetical protein